MSLQVTLREVIAADQVRVHDLRIVSEMTQYVDIACVVPVRGQDLGRA